MLVPRALPAAPAGSRNVSDADCGPRAAGRRLPGQVCSSPFWHHFDPGENTLCLERAFCIRGDFQI